MPRLVYGFGLLVVWGLAELAGCDAVPTLSFVYDSEATGDARFDDSATDDTGLATDGTIGDDGSTDGPGVFGDASDAPLQTGCAGMPPLGANVCCGTIWCIGECDANCAFCERCASGAYCCDKLGVPQCKASTSSPSACK